MCRCFKCRKPLDSSMVGADPWEVPNGAVAFSGGGNFGSALYDTMVDKISVEIVVCDECLKIAKKDDNRLREVITHVHRNTK